MIIGEHCSYRAMVVFRFGMSDRVDVSQSGKVKIILTRSIPGAQISTAPKLRMLPNVPCTMLELSYLEILWKSVHRFPTQHPKMFQNVSCTIPYLYRKFHANRLYFPVMLLTDIHADIHIYRQTDKQTDSEPINPQGWKLPCSTGVKWRSANN